MMSVGRPMSGGNKMTGGPAGSSTNGPGTLVDVDPETVPSSMKIEGPDWFAL